MTLVIGLKHEIGRCTQLEKKLISTRSGRALMPHGERFTDESSLENSGLVPGTCQRD